MANRYLYQGVSPAFTRNTGTVTQNTTAGSFNSTYCDHSVLFNSSGSFICDFTTGDGADDYATTSETIYIRFDHYYGNTGTGHNAAVLLNNSDQQLSRVRLNSSTTVRLEYNSGTLAAPAWTQLGTDITTANSTRYTWVLKLTIDPAGTAHAYELFKDNVSQLSGTFSMALLTRVDAVKFGDSASTAGFISQVMATVGTSLVGSFVASLKASGAGSNSGMTGAYTDVNEVTLSDATAISSGTAGQRTTLAIADLPALPGGLTVGAETRHTFRANNDGTAPTNLKPVIRQGGVDTVGAAVSGLGLGYGPFMKAYTLTYTQINTAGFELGWESAA